MSIELATKFLPYVDEKFSSESKLSMLTNNDFDWAGAHTVKVYKIGTSEMYDYDRTGTSARLSRYGELKNLDATTEEFVLKKGRSFTFPIDKLDTDETNQQLQAAAALERQTREIVIPEVDQYVYSVMCTNAGNKPDAVETTTENVYDLILAATEALDDAEVPEDGRVLLVSPTTYRMMKHCPEIVMETDIGQDLRAKGVLAMLDGCTVTKVPSSRLPKNFGFMVAHPCATVAPVKLESYKVHEDPPYHSGSLVEGRIVYDAFVLDNKKDGIYYQKVTSV